MSVIELTTFTVKPEATAAMPAARPGMADAFRRDRRGFIAAKLIRVVEDTGLDQVEWAEDTAWDESRAKGGDQPEIAAFFATIDTLVSSDRGVRYDDAEDGRRAVRTVAYGPHPSQVGELYVPEGDGPFPVVVLVHGGYWLARPPSSGRWSRSTRARALRAGCSAATTTRCPSATPRSRARRRCRC
jgi:acetyl esterase/lipase